LLKTGNVFTDRLTAAHCPQGSLLKKAFGVSLIFRKHRSIDVMKMSKKGSVSKKKKKEKEKEKARKEKGVRERKREKGIKSGVE